MDCNSSIAINLKMAHEYNIAQHQVEAPNNCCQPELLTRGMCEGSVVEDTVERNSRGKSRCEQMCCFQTLEDFTAHQEMHPLKHLLCSIQFQCGVMCINQIHHHPNEPKLQQSLTNKDYSMNQRDIQQNTKEV